MTMESTLKKLESRIEEFVKTHQKATARVAELEGQVAELTKKQGPNEDLSEKVKALEAQRAEWRTASKRCSAPSTLPLTNRQ